MMMQNAQMHQVIMNNMTMSALSYFGYMQAPEVNKILMQAAFWIEVFSPLLIMHAKVA